MPKMSRSRSRLCALRTSIGLGFGWYFVYLRINPRKRLVRGKPAALSVPSGINEMCSM
jgi:hypothetical protein